MGTLARDYQRGCVELFPNIPPLINFSRQRYLLLTTGRVIAHAGSKSRRVSEQAVNYSNECRSEFATATM